MKELCWRLERDTFDRRRGLGLWYERGCTGTQYGDPRRNEYLHFKLLVLFVQINLHFAWKGRVDE